MSKKMVRLGAFREDPDNVSEATEEEIQRLAGKLKRVPLGLTAMRIAYVTDAPGGGCMVISGNKRLRVLKQAFGDDGEVPAEWFADVTEMSEAERHEFRLNANVSDGHFNLDKLLEQYGTEELTAAGLADLLDGIKTDVEESGKTDADAVPEVASESVRSKRGQIYLLGEHRLMCGDSTSADDVARLMNGEKADMVFTDPPYNVNYADKNKFLNAVDKGNRNQREIINDNEATDEDCAEKLWKPAFSNLQKYAKDCCSIYVTMPQGGAHMMMMMMMCAASWQVKHELIWVKNNHVLGRVDCFYKHEPILYGWNKTHKFYGKGKFDKSVWEIPKPQKSDLHPTMKPIALIENALLNSSKKDDIITDFFGGSGSTLIACEKLNRKNRMMELDPRYCDVIRRRWAEFVHGEGCDWEKLTPAIES